MADTEPTDTAYLCRDCLHLWHGEARRECPRCHEPRIVSHPELTRLHLAHVDSDAFFAAIEKRDDPSLAHRPVIIGGGRRGVVATACYIARQYGIRSAMPMFRARRLCPDAVVIKPDIEKYRREGRRIRRIFESFTPAVEPLSIDEAFLDLGGTERYHHRTPAQSLCVLARQVEEEIGITISVGLSYNKSLAKMASDLDKPRGFACIGRQEARSFLSPRPVGDIWGVGKATEKVLHREGIRTIGDLQQIPEEELFRRFGQMGHRLHAFARGIDERPVKTARETKSISAETTFETDLRRYDELCQALWPLSETVARRLRQNDLCGRTVTLKLKTASFQSLTRARTLEDPTQLAEYIFRAASALLKAEADGTPYRLIGVGVSHLDSGDKADPGGLFDRDRQRIRIKEQVLEEIRDRFGRDAIATGRAISRKRRGPPPQKKD